MAWLEQALVVVGDTVRVRDDKQPDGIRRFYSPVSGSIPMTVQQYLEERANKDLDARQRGVHHPVQA
jgi:hypothetical protein